MSGMIERVARAIFEAWRAAESAEATWEDALKGHAAGEVEYPNFFRTVELARKEARDAIEAMERDWRPMDTAPTDGTVVEVVGRYPTATSGFPQYVSYHDGKWWRHSRNAPEEIIPWAWRPRTDWPDEMDAIR